MGAEGVVGISNGVDSDRCYSGNSNLDGLTFDLGDLLDSGSTINLFDNVTSFNRYFDVFGDGDIDTVFGGDLLTSVFDNGGGGESHGSGHGGDMCGIGCGTQKKLRIGLGLTFLQQNGGAEGSGWGGAMFGGHVLTSLFVSDFLIDDGFGFAHGFGSRGATLYFDFFDCLFTVGCKGNLCRKSGGEGHLGLGFGSAVGEGGQEADDSDLKKKKNAVNMLYLFSNHDYEVVVFSFHV